MGLKIYCCGQLLTTKYCPNCGISLEERVKRQTTKYPVKFVTYLHGTGAEDTERKKFYELLGIQEGSVAATEIEGCDYEVGIVWSLEHIHSVPKPIACLHQNAIYSLSVASKSHSEEIKKDILLS